MTNLLDILDKEGIVIRKIPHKTTSLFSYNERRGVREGEVIVEMYGRNFVKSEKVNSFGENILLHS